MQVSSIKKIDTLLGTPIVIGLGILNKLWFLKKYREPKKILAIQLWSIGESILTLPTLKHLRSMYPHAHIEVLTTERAREVFEGQPYIDHLTVMGADPQGIMRFVFSHIRSYNLVVDFEEYLNISSVISFMVGKYRIGFDTRYRGLTLSQKVQYNDQQHVVETHLDLIRSLWWKGQVKELEQLHYSHHDEKAVDKLMKGHKIAKKKPLVILCPGTAESAKSRMWPLEKWAELADLLIEKKKASIAIIGTYDEQQNISRVIGEMKNGKGVANLAGKLSAKQLFCLEEKADLVISNDSGPMHIGTAMKTKTIGLFGPNLPVRFRPFGKYSIGIYKGEICKYSPCINVHKGQVPECLQPNHDNICMKNIGVEDVMRVVNNLLS